jgi:hypothetical protein
MMNVKKLIAKNFHMANIPNLNIHRKIHIAFNPLTTRNQMLAFGAFDFVLFKGSDQRENRGVWSNINTMYLVWRCGDRRSFAL